MKSKLHSELQDKGMDYLLAKSYWVRAIEMPTLIGIIDIWGLSRSRNFDTMAIEVKVSSNDFRSNSQTYKNQIPYHIANRCFILCPAGLIQENEVNEDWGLLWYEEGKKLVNKKQPKFVGMTDRRKLGIIINFLFSGINNPKQIYGNKTSKN